MRERRGAMRRTDNDAERYLSVDGAESSTDSFSPESRFNRYQSEGIETKTRIIAYNEESSVITSREILTDDLKGSENSHNLLVVSDLHLGDSLRPSDDGYLKNLARLNRALCRFLKHYARHRVEGRPWRLVIAGDMIDFLHAGLFGTLREGQREGVSFGSEEAAIAWLERVMVRERRVFRMLAIFVGAGHELVIIKGNHDAQFHFEGVQRRFVELLLELYVRRLIARREKDKAAEIAQETVAFTKRISFCRWFYYERDLVYIEHGNQYDAFCSFEHVLSPIYSDHFELEDPISHRTYREFAELVGTSLDVHSIDKWTLVDYVRWVAGLGPKMIGQLAYTYFASVSWLVRTKRRLVTAALKARDEHLKRRTMLTRRFGLSEDILRALDELRARPAGNSVFAGLNMLYMDRIALLAINLCLALTMLIVPGPWMMRAGIILGVSTLSLFVNRLLDGYRTVDPHPKLMRIASRVAGLLKVPFVVFGHTHQPVVAPTHENQEAWYFNTGSWTSAGDVGLTHVCILRHAKPKAELRRWCLLSHKPLLLKAPQPAES
jgi:UDP-2,3-diacylglucosamine pyrophosphatase LpxH